MGQANGTSISYKFDPDDVFVLRSTWKEMSQRSGGKGIDKQTFQSYFQLWGLLGERLYAQFDRKGTGFINCDDFISGMEIIHKGSDNDKMHLVFKMFDVSKKGSVSRQELTTLLNQIPKGMLDDTDTFTLRTLPPSIQRLSPLMKDAETKPETKATVTSSTTSDAYVAATAANVNTTDTAKARSGTAIEPAVLKPLAVVDKYTYHDLAELAFVECDVNHDDRFNLDEFKMWLGKNPSVVRYFQSVIPQDIFRRGIDNGRSTPSKSAVDESKLESTKLSKPMIKSGSGIFSSLQSKSSSKIGSSTSLAEGGRAYSGFFSGHLSLRWSSFGSSQQGDDTEDEGCTAPPQAHSPHQRERKGSNQEHIFQSRENTSAVPMHLQHPDQHAVGVGIADNSEDRESPRPTPVIKRHSDSAIEGYLYRKGMIMMSKLYYVLVGSSLYYYKKQHELRPKGVIFLAGIIVERHIDEDHEAKGYYGFELFLEEFGAPTIEDTSAGDQRQYESRVFFCQSAEARDEWVTNLQHAAHVVPIEEDYILEEEIGRGAYGKVCRCVSKKSGIAYAVKIIHKSTVQKENRENLSSEIAADVLVSVLKMVKHPHIINMVGLYENKLSVFMVMELVQGGDLLDRINGKARYTEIQAAQLLRPLLEGIAYLHDLGIIHRDLKPENILCGEKPEDLKIIDFGLSKMVLPREKMISQCGTVFYVAPEVWTKQGYSKEADIFSVGVILFLLLCGKVPFQNESETISYTFDSDPEGYLKSKVEEPIWTDLSESAKSLMISMLEKSVRDRITARAALTHPFLKIA